MCHIDLFIQIGEYGVWVPLAGLVSPSSCEVQKVVTKKTALPTEVEELYRHL